MKKAHPPASGRRRNREETQQTLLDAALAILREQGFDAIGVNAIAERAGVSKVLIYRYFGGYDGLLKALAEQIDPLDAGAARRILAQTGKALSPAEVLQQAVLNLHRSVSENDLVRNLLVWELSHQNEITRVMADSREQIGLEQTALLQDYLNSCGLAEDLDLNALMALVTAGVFYLTLRSSSAQYFNGIDIRSPEGWQRIANVLAPFIQTLENTPPRGDTTRPTPVRGIVQQKENPER